MVEYIVRTDKPIRLDEILHSHGIKFEVKRLDKHERLIDAEKLKLKKKHSSKEFFENIVSVFEIDNAPTIVEAST